MITKTFPIIGHGLGYPGCIGVTSIQVVRFRVITSDDGSIFLSHIQTLTARYTCMQGLIDPDYRSLFNGVVIVSSEYYNEEE